MLILVDWLVKSHHLLTVNNFKTVRKFIYHFQTGDFTLRSKKIRTAIFKQLT